MAQQHLKIAIFGNEYQAKKSASIEKILLYLEKKSMWRMPITSFSPAVSTSM